MNNIRYANDIVSFVRRHQSEENKNDDLIITSRNYSPMVPVTQLR